MVYAIAYRLRHSPYGSTSPVRALVGSLPHMRRSLPFPFALPGRSGVLDWRLRSNILSSSSLTAHHLEPGRVNPRNGSGRRRGFDLSRSGRSPIITVVGFLSRSRRSPSITITVTVTVGLLGLSGRCLPIITGLLGSGSRRSPSATVVLRGSGFILGPSRVRSWGREGSIGCSPIVYTSDWSYDQGS